MRSSRDPSERSLLLSRPVLIQAALLLTILALAAALRFAGLAHQGFIYWDEAKFALEGIRLQHVILALAGHGDPPLGKPVGSAKPGHALLIALSYPVLGVHAYSAQSVNALFSVATVVLVYVLARRLFGPVVGMIAAALLAVSRYDVIYARSALSESDAAFFLVLGVILWLRAPTWAGQGVRFQLLSGVVLGFAFTVNYRLSVYIAVIVVIDLAWLVSDRVWKWAAQRAAVWAGSLLVAPLMWQVADAVARTQNVVLFFNEITGHSASYAAEVVYQLHQGKQSVLHFEPLSYPSWFVTREGWAIFLLVLVGIAFAGRRRTREWAVVTGLVLVPYAGYVFAPFVVPRNLEAAIPFASILAAAALLELVGTIPLPGRGLIATGAALALTVMGASMCRPVTSMRSGFARATEYVDKRGGRALTTTEIMVFYLRGPGGGCRAPALPLNLRRLHADIEAGYHYAVLEQHHNTVVSDYIRSHAVLAVQYPAYGHISLGESLISSENGDYPDAHAPIELVDVYQLAHLGLPPAGRVAPNHCVLRVPV